MSDMIKALKGKLDSEEKWNAFISEFFPDIPRVGHYTIDGESSDSPWWSKREQLRIVTGIYIQSQCLTEVNNLRPGLFVHVSTDDPTMVAYTIDAEAGKADRQIKTTFGKFLRKNFILFADHLVESLTTKHKADLSNEVEFVSGMEIVAVYASDSLSSCMTKNFTGSDYRLPNNPVEAYDMPNIRMAVLRNKDGEVNARCMVYEPAPDDLRYIRGYGEMTLVRRLERLGYKPGNWIGAEFKKMPAPTKGADYYVLPYFDADGAMANAMSGLPMLKDNKIVMVTNDYASRVRNTFPNVAVGSSSNTGGAQRLTNFDSSLAHTYDPILDRQIDVMEMAQDRVPRLYYVDGKVISSHATTSEYQSYRRRVDGNTKYEAGLCVDRHTQHNSSRHRAYAMSYDAKFEYRGYTYLETQENRLALGFVRLSQKYYPELYGDGTVPEYLTDRNSYIVLEEGTEKHPVLLKDCYIVVERHPDWAAGYETYKATHHHKSTLDKTSLTKVHRTSLKSPDTWTLHTNVVQTKSGRKVIPKFHDVQIDATCGMWDFTRNLVSSYLGGELLYYPSGMVHAALDASIRNKLGAKLEEWRAQGCSFAQLEDLLLSYDMDNHVNVPTGHNVRVVRGHLHGMSFIQIVQAVADRHKANIYRHSDTKAKKTAQFLRSFMLNMVADMEAVEPDSTHPADAIVSEQEQAIAAFNEAVEAGLVTIGTVSQSRLDEVSVEIAEDNFVRTAALRAAPAPAVDTSNTTLLGTGAFAVLSAQTATTASIFSQLFTTPVVYNNP